MFPGCFSLHFKVSLSKIFFFFLVPELFIVYSNAKNLKTVAFSRKIKWHKFVLRNYTIVMRIGESEIERTEIVN